MLVSSSSVPVLEVIVVSFSGDSGIVIDILVSFFSISEKVDEVYISF